jgi:proteasome accessory factor C
MVGTPPYTPGDYLSIDDEGDEVDLFLAPVFDRPVRLTPDEGLAVLAAGTALLAVPGVEAEGPLARALGKVRRAIGAEAVEVPVDLGEPAHLGAVRDAAARGVTLEVEYWTSGRAERNRRRIDPSPPFFALGNWYTEAWCHLRGATRLFRVDRIREVSPTDERFTPAPPTGVLDLYAPTPDAVTVVLEVPETATRTLEALPQATRLEGDGPARFTLPVSHERWLERLLVLLGPGTRVLEPTAWSDLAARTATRLLDRYR